MKLASRPQNVVPRLGISGEIRTLKPMSSECGQGLLALLFTEQTYSGNAYLPDIQFTVFCFLLMYKSLVLLGLYGRSVNVFSDGYSFRTLLCNAINNENKKQTNNKTGFPRVYCELQ